MFKKALIGVASTAAFLGMAVPAMATFFPVFPMPSDDIEVKNIDTTVINKVYTKASSGDNSIGGMFVSGGKITTGMAYADAGVQNVVNFSKVNTCGYCSNGDVEVKNIDTTVVSKVYTRADSGDNSIGGMVVGGFHGPSITTGASYAYSTVVGEVNTTLIGDVVLE